MRPSRIIPTLLLRRGGLYKTVRFADARYVGDPINAVRIFNDKEVDEIVVLDISATVERRPISFDLIADIAGEAFMPMCYGGGVRSMADLDRLFAVGVEKVALNSALVDTPALLTEAASAYGSQSVAASIDVRHSGRRDVVWTHAGSRNTRLDVVEHARRCQEMGAGEIVLGSIDRDGTSAGYDTGLLERVSRSVSIPVVALGGAGKPSDLADGLVAGAAAVAAGSMFVFKGARRAVLISYLSGAERQLVEEAAARATR